jgi:hypothetical protein
LNIFVNSHNSMGHFGEFLTSNEGIIPLSWSRCADS